MGFFHSAAKCFKVPLIFVPTPLGNLRDITLRALDALKSADLIVAEDTRVTHRLLSAHGISGIELATFHAHSPQSKIDEILERAREQHVIFVSDAGMPGISDPGSELVRAAREAQVTIDVLPGPCAFIGAAVLSGFSIVGLAFEGFVARAAGARSTELSTALRSGRTTAWYESPHRIIATLETLEHIAPESQVFVLREYTKRFEQQIFGHPRVIIDALELPVRGEITMVLSGQTLSPQQPERSESDLDARMSALRNVGLRAAAIAKTLAKEGWGERSALYAQLTQRGKHDDQGPTQA
jgi:16S rRNA (cytidine1402-2'-O)-methyltransferase